MVAVFDRAFLSQAFIETVEKKIPGEIERVRKNRFHAVLSRAIARVSPQWLRSRRVRRTRPGRPPAPASWRDSDRPLLRDTLHRCCGVRGGTHRDQPRTMSCVRCD